MQHRRFPTQNGPYHCYSVISVNEEGSKWLRKDRGTEI